MIGAFLIERSGDVDGCCRRVGGGIHACAFAFAERVTFVFRGAVLGVFQNKVATGLILNKVQTIGI